MEIVDKAPGEGPIIGGSFLFTTHGHLFMPIEIEKKYLRRIQSGVALRLPPHSKS